MYGSEVVKYSFLSPHWSCCSFQCHIKYIQYAIDDNDMPYIFTRSSNILRVHSFVLLTRSPVINRCHRPYVRYVTVIRNIFTIYTFIYKYTKGSLCFWNDNYVLWNDIFMYKYSNQLLSDVFDNLFSKHADVHEYNTRNTFTQHVYVCLKGKTWWEKKTLRYCGACIWNYILDNVDSKCAIGLFKKRIQRLLFFSQRWPYYMIQ